MAGLGAAAGGAAPGWPEASAVSGRAHPARLGQPSGAAGPQGVAAQLRRLRAGLRHGVPYRAAASMPLGAALPAAKLVSEFGQDNVLFFSRAATGEGTA